MFISLFKCDESKIFHLEVVISFKAGDMLFSKMWFNVFILGVCALCLMIVVYEFVFVINKNVAARFSVIFNYISLS